MIAGDVYRCGLDWCQDSTLEWWTVPLFVVAGVVLFRVLQREVGKARDGWVYDGGWFHCDRPSFYDDDENEQVCSKCQASFAWRD
jgi:hypothetical protein